MTPARALVTDEGVEVSGADPDGVHQIGSVTKVCTGLLLALEVVEGALTLETRVGELLPELTGPIGGVTLGQLVTHTSGLPRLPPGMWRKAFGAAARDPYADLDESALLAAVAGTSPRPTSRPRYSNLGFGLLGTALTRHRGTTYGALVRDRVTGPLGMTATDVHVEEHVPGHTRRGRPHRQARPDRPGDGLDAGHGQGRDAAVARRRHRRVPQLRRRRSGSTPRGRGAGQLRPQRRPRGVPAGQPSVGAT